MSRVLAALYGMSIVWTTACFIGIPVNHGAGYCMMGVSLILFVVYVMFLWEED